MTTTNRVSVRWVGPSWLRRFDNKQRRLPFWRAHAIRLANPKTTESTVVQVAQLKYLQEIRIADRLQLSESESTELRRKVPQVKFLPNPFAAAAEVGN